jgi:PAS domain-containing protein
MGEKNMAPSIDASSATATQLVRDFPEVRRMADFGPVRITSHGRTELVMLSPSEFAQIANGDSADVNRLAGKLTIVLDNIDTAVLIFDETLHVRAANPAMCQLVDSDEGQIIGLHATELVSHPSHRYTADRLAEVHRSGCAEVLTTASARDLTRTLQIRLKPWPGGVALFADDITDRMRFADTVIACRHGRDRHRPGAIVRHDPGREQRPRSDGRRQRHRLGGSAPAKFGLTPVPRDYQRCVAEVGRRVPAL